MTLMRAAGASIVLAGILATGASAQALRPDPIGAEKHHRAAVEYFDQAQKDTTLTADQKRDAIQKGIAAESRALALDPDHIVALVYKNILLRMLAVEAKDGQERENLTRQADALGNRVLALQAGHPERGFLHVGGARDVSASMPADFKALVDKVHPLRVGGTVKTPTRLRDTLNVYPPIAQMVRIQGVVIVEALIGVDGHVRAARVLRSIPLLDEAALACVRQWQFTPTVLNGAPVAVLLTIQQNFVLQ
jgi:TonB family protein